LCQFGIPGKPEIAKVWEHESIRDDSVAQSNLRGFIAYAMTGPDARTTQLFINLRIMFTRMRKDLRLLGRVISGMEVVDSLFAGYVNLRVAECAPEAGKIV